MIAAMDPRPWTPAMPAARRTRTTLPGAGSRRERADPHTASGRITIRADGPYDVSGGVPLRGADGTLLDTGSSYALCRCGRSSTKPFCDDTHEAIAFDGTETANRGPVEDMRTPHAGRDITVLDARRICAHAAVCTDNLPEVFDVTRGRWIDPDAAPADRLADVVSRCPSGALAYALAGSTEAVEGELEPGIRCWRSAAYVVTGGIEIVGADGRAYAPRPRATLCRCGATRNQPFCDGGHDDVDLGD
jgi:CDGSH-type Zn-finger protein